MSFRVDALHIANFDYSEMVNKTHGFVGEVYENRARAMSATRPHNVSPGSRISLKSSIPTPIGIPAHPVDQESGKRPDPERSPGNESIVFLLSEL